MPRTSQEIESTIHAILVDEFEVDADKLRPEARLVEDLDMDSLDGVDLVVALEKAFALRIAEDEARSIRTLGDIFDRVHRQLDAGNAAR